MCGKHIERKGLMNSISWRIKIKKQLLVIFLIPDLRDYRGTKVVWGYGISAEASIHYHSRKIRKGTKRKGNTLLYLLILFIEQTRF